MPRAWQEDAREFGLLVRQGGWRLGLLVARNVEKGQGEGGGGTDGSHRNNRYSEAGKVSAQKFAKESDTSAPRVLRYLAAWEQAAEAGYVPAAGILTPGEEVDLDAEKLPEWEEFYPPGDSNWHGASDERKAAITAAAKEQGVSTSQVARAGASPKALIAAASVLKPKDRVALAQQLARDQETVDAAVEDPATRLQTRKALNAHDEREHQQRRQAATHGEPAKGRGEYDWQDEMTAVSVDFMAIRRKLIDIGGLIGQSDAVHTMSDYRDMVVAHVDGAIDRLQAIKAVAEGGESIADAIGRILQEEDN